MPPLKVATSSVVPLSENVTVPVGAPDPAVGFTCAVSVKGRPYVDGLRLDERFVVVGSEPVISNEIGTAKGLLAIPGETIAICPVYVPACRPVGATVVVNVEGMVPFAGVTESHDPPVADVLNVADGNGIIVSARL